MYDIITVLDDKNSTLADVAIKVAELLDEHRNTDDTHLENVLELLTESEEEDYQDILDDYIEELEALLNRTGYTFGTVEGDPHHYVLAPLSGESNY